MLLDLQNCFSDAQAITDTAASTNIVRMSKGVFKEVAFGTPLPLNIQVVEDFVNAENVRVDVETCPDQSFGSSDTVVLASATMTNLTAGSKAPITYIPAGNLGFMRLKYTPTAEASKTITAGKFSAGIVAAHDNSYQNM